MIVSHEHRFIFVKTRKTAGTSIEVFLAKHAGADAIVTPVVPAVPGHDARNADRPFNPLPQMLHQRKVRPALSDLRRHRTYFNHMPAARIRERVGPKVWDSYYKFCFERDPWEKVVSWYWFRQWKTPDLSFRDFVLSQDLPTDWRLYTLDDRVAVDFVGRFERLTDDLAAVLQTVGIDAPVELTREKGTSRPADERGAATFTAELDAHVARVFAHELTTFDYPDRST